MSRFVLFPLIVVAVLLGLDYYVYRNWRRFSISRRRLRWTLPVNRVRHPPRGDAADTETGIA